MTTDPALSGPGSGENRTLLPTAHERVEYGWAFVCAEEQEGHAEHASYDDHNVVNTGFSDDAAAAGRTESFINNHKVRLVQRTVATGDWEFVAAPPVSGGGES